MCFAQRAGLLCLCVGCLGYLSASWVNLCQDYLGPRAEALLTYPQRICLAGQSCKKQQWHEHAQTPPSPTMLLNFKTEFVSAEPTGKLVLMSAAHKLVPYLVGDTVQLAKDKNCLHLPTAFAHCTNFLEHIFCENQSCF